MVIKRPNDFWAGVMYIAFGAEPPAVSGVAVSTDTDNTGETAESFYGDVAFRARRPA